LLPLLIDPRELKMASEAIGVKGTLVRWTGEERVHLEAMLHKGKQMKTLESNIRHRRSVGIWDRGGHLLYCSTA
jgi:hypothetical protein